MAKVLFLPVGIGLAHTGRCIMIAHELEKLGIKVIFGAGGEAPEILKKEQLPYQILPEFRRDAYEKIVKDNNWNIYTTSVIDSFVKAEVSLIKKEKPDLIVSDTRITAKISSKMTRITQIAVNNVDVTKYYDFDKIKIPHKSFFRKVLPRKVDEFLDKERGQRVLKRLAPRVVRTLFLRTLLKFNFVMAKYHLKPLLDPYDMALGDLTLLADIPQFRPVKKLPPNIKMVGPIFWEGFATLPSWAKEIDNNKNIIYVTASGTGDKEVFIRVLKYFQNTSYTIVATTGNTLTPDEVDFRYPKLFITDFIPGKWIMRIAKLIIFPGGNATSYQALKYGVPQIGIPLHLDQEDNLNQLERLGTGVTLFPDKNLNRKNLLETVDKILKDKTYRENARKISLILGNYNGARKAAFEITDFLKKVQ